MLKDKKFHVYKYLFHPTVYVCVDWLISLFNGISTFVGYLMPKPFS